MFGRRRNKGGAAVDHPGEPLRNEALVDAMRAVSVQDTAQSRALLFQLMLDSTLIVMTPVAPATTKTWTTEPGDKLSLVTWSDADGSVLPVFTSTAALLRHRSEGGGYVALPASALFEMAERAGTSKVVFDPGSPTTGFVTRSEIEALGRGRLPVGGGSEVVAAATAIRIGRPAAGLQPSLVGAIRAGCGATSLVERAWLTMIQQGDLPPEVVVAVRFQSGGDEATMRSLIDEIGAKAGPEVSALRFLVADDSLQSTLDDGAGEVLYP